MTGFHMLLHFDVHGLKRSQQLFGVLKFFQVLCDIECMCINKNAPSILRMFSMFTSGGRGRCVREDVSTE